MTANQILTKYHIIVPPINVAGIVTNFGWNIGPGNIWGVSIDPSIKMITVGNDNRSYERFYIAHALGHIVKQHTKAGLFRECFAKCPDTRFTETEEEEANQFAANLLMPFWMLDLYAMASEFKWKPFSFHRKHSPGDLARIFDVPTRTMNIRLAEMVGYNVSWKNSK